MNELSKPVCTLCGGEVIVIEHISYTKDRKTIAEISTHFNCKKEGCKAVTIIPLPEDAALERFSARPESAWNMYRRLTRVYSVVFTGKLHRKICEAENFQYTTIPNSLSAFMDKYEHEAISIMQQIEKELKG